MEDEILTDLVVEFIIKVEDLKQIKSTIPTEEILLMLLHLERNIKTEEQPLIIRLEVKV
jgi:hypothetical protein